MITDRNEAFKHNSCKKLAQLGKVIFTMSSQARDRDDEAISLQNEFEDLIQKTVNNYHENAESIAKGLVQFRKKCVDDSCREFGQNYKNLKKDFADLKLSQGERLGHILEESKNLINIIKESQSKMLQSASAAIKEADEFNADVRTHQTRPTTTRREVRSNVQPIFDKMDQAQLESDERIKQMRLKFANDIANSKGEVNLYVKNELISRKGKFQSIKNDLISLDNDLDGLKREFASCIQRGKEFFKSKHQYRDDLVHCARDSCTEVLRQIKTAKNGDQKAHKQHQINLSDLKTQFQHQKNDHKMTIDHLRRQHREQKRQRHQFQDRIGYEIQKKQNVFNSVSQDMVKNYKAQIKKKKNIQKLIVTNIEECESDTNRLIEIIKSSINESMARMDNKILASKYKIEQQEKDEEKRLVEEKDDFQKRCTERLAILESAIDAQNAMSEAINHKQVKRNRHLRHEIKRSAAAHETAINEVSEKAKKEYDGAHEHTSNRLAQKTKEIESALRRRREDKEKRQNELKTKFQSDLNISIEETNTKNKEILKEHTEKITEQNKLDKEIQDHELNITKLNAKNDYLAKRKLELKDEIQKMEENFQNEISTLEKAKRQFLRRTKAETQHLDEEYEMKIQIAQVNLRNSIENISKLYDKDENQRGVEIIEAIRKVQEAKNRMQDFRMQREMELRLFNKENDVKSKQIKEKIEKYQNNDDELKLQKKLEEIEVNSTKTCSELTEKAKKEIESLLEKIETFKLENENEIELIAAEKEREINYFTEQSAEIEGEKEKIQMEFEFQTSEIDSKYDSKFEQLNQEHEVSLDKMRRRIDAAKNNRDEALEKQNKEISDLNQKNFQEIERKQNENQSSTQNIFAETRQKSDSLSKRIDELTSKQTELEFSLCDPPSRRGDQKRLEILRKKIEDEDERQYKSFEALYDFIRDAPNQVSEEEPPAIINRPTSSGVNPGTTPAKSGRKEKGMTPRVKTPNMTIEAKMRKRPQLVAPQLA